MPTTQKSTVKTAYARVQATIWHSQCSRMLIRFSGEQATAWFKAKSEIK